MRPEWFPDWRGLPAAIIASGPSTKNADVNAVRGMRTIAIKENVDIAPWADIVYGCDGHFWRNRNGLPDYRGLKVSWARDLGAVYPDIKFIDIEAHTDRILTANPGTLGSGGNSGFQALNLAVQFGAKKIVLVGFDMHDRSGAHWYGRNNGPGRNNPNEDNFRRWRAAFDVSAADLHAMSVEVINASPISVLKCFGKCSVEQVVAEWGVCALA